MPVKNIDRYKRTVTLEKKDVVVKEKNVSQMMEQAKNSKIDN